MRVLLATTNRHKSEEIRAVIKDPSVEWVGLESLGREVVEPVEDGETFEANAVAKARHYAGATGLWCLADDSGLEVDALGGEPGVRSARYAGIDGPPEVVDRANNRLLLERLGGTAPEARTARFVCAMALVCPEPLPGPSRGRRRAHDRPVAVPEGAGSASRNHSTIVALVRGTVEGRILRPEEVADPAAHPAELGRGSHGFGYDPLFLVPGLGKTTAELSSEQKNLVSHRGEAARKMRETIEELSANR